MDERGHAPKRVAEHGVVQQDRVDGPIFQLASELAPPRRDLAAGAWQRDLAAVEPVPAALEPGPLEAAEEQFGMGAHAARRAGRDADDRNPHRCRGGRRAITLLATVVAACARHEVSILTGLRCPSRLAAVG